MANAALAHTTNHGHYKADLTAEAASAEYTTDIYGVRTHNGPVPALQPGDVNVDFDGFATLKKKFDCFK